MREEVGQCKMCGTKILCLDGFFNGIIDSDGLLTCFLCDSVSKGEEMEGCQGNNV
ncbi:hypothetical protein J2S74_003737 [Evansella vedderi]|uniref:Uncharacterized protein n=1 Tax=Evansella vedderi TaxID=38282 RepID=A0ABT9ZZY0_9BACI|nr:hypothetical protein [Evansella vedderi]MDQ0256317.1 hypothetical protein [Evansella vedderi]